MHRPSIRLALVFACLASLACSSDQKLIEDEPTGKVDKSSASWEEPGAEPDLPLDAGPAPMDASTDAAMPDAGSDAGVDAATASDAGTDAGATGDAGAVDAG